MKEEWKEIDSCPNYLISNYGEVFSKRRNRLLKSNIGSDGYLYVTLFNNVWSYYSIHRLVAFAFVDGYFEGAVVNHIDGIKQNNTVSNLEWITHGDNVRHAVVLGLFPRRFQIIETGDIFLKVSTCARHIDGNSEAILRCLNKKQRSHKNYTFEYVN